MTTPIALTPDQSALLLDESLIEAQQGIERRVIPGTKSPPLVRPDPKLPWEYCGDGLSKRIHVYGTVMYDDLMGKYRMWYMTRMGPHWRYESGNYQIPGLFVPRSDERPFNCNGVTHDAHGRAFQGNDRGDLICYAESDDGVEWWKPNLGIFTFDGSGDNNIVWDHHGMSVFIDRAEPDDNKRYKAIGYNRRYNNIYLLSSPDGIHWDDSDHLEAVAERRNEGAFNVSWDQVSGVYRAYSIERAEDELRRRTIFYTESPQLEGPWKDSMPIVEASSWDDEIARRRYGALRAEYYDLSGFRYHNLHIGLVGTLYVTQERIPGEKNQMPCDGPIDAQLMYSRDGMEWRHADRDRTPAIPRGEAGDWDGGMIIGTATEPIVEGDAIHWYYTGAQHFHGETDLEKRRKSIGRATWQRDRFVAAAASGSGELTTKALAVPEGAAAVEVNARPARGSDGQVTAELRGASGHAIDGFAAADCTALREDSLRWRVRWRGGQLPAGVGALKVHFALQDAELFSVALVSDP